VTIRSQARIISIKIGRIVHQNRRPAYGKIKVAPPHRRQAIGMACLPAGASVGARAARSQKPNDSNIDFGTHALALFGEADR
jgi:hypothetical protein